MKTNKIEGWKFPCDKQTVSWNRHGWVTISVRDALAKEEHMMEECNCGKNCKPVKVRIIEEIVE